MHHCREYTINIYVCMQENLSALQGLALSSTCDHITISIANIRQLVTVPGFNGSISWGMGCQFNALRIILSMQT